MNRRFVLGLATSALLATGAWAQSAAGSAAGTAATTPPKPAASPPAGPAQAPKVLRYAFRVAETGFDPAQISDVYSRIVASNIFDAPLAYDFLARPVKLVPQTAESLPEVSNNFRNWVFRIRPGIYFADDPAFKGRPRELTAADYVYAIKRHYDPVFKSPSLYQFENAKVLGLSELRKKALDSKQPFDYDTEVEGLRVLDRYSFEIRLGEPAPRFQYFMAESASVGAVAREVIEAYPGKAMEHPVGTGPFRLAQWKRSSKIVLERNPSYRHATYQAEPAADDAEGQALLARLKGRKLPMVDRVEVSIIDEPQPRWLSFLNGQHDMIEWLPEEFTSLAIPNNQLAPHLAKKGVSMERVLAGDATFTFFNMEHPTVGGYTADRVALRRAIALAYDSGLEAVLVRRNQAVVAQGIIPPNLFGHDPALTTEMSQHSVARAKALLDLYGYTDRNGDGFRDMPDGQPLVLEYSSQPDQLSKQLQELWRKAMTSINVRIEFKVAKWPENLKASRAGKLMMWGVAWRAAIPDGGYFLELMYGPNKGQANHSRFDQPTFNALYQRQLVMADGPERAALMRDLMLLGVVYMPYKVNVHRYITDLMHPQVIGYRRHPFMREFWRYVDVDNRLVKP